MLCGVGSCGNFFMLWGEPLLGAKKEREKEEESSCLVSLHQYSIS
jgi:hypothetical protein